VETVEYLHFIYPESINITDNDGYYPLNYAIWGADLISASVSVRATNDDHKDLIRFLLLNSPGAVSQPLLDDGVLALHIACMCRLSLEIVKLVYNAYPQAIHTGDSDGETPLDFCQNGGTRTFFEAQLE
jgi:ankyrin repeat protein